MENALYHNVEYLKQNAIVADEIPAALHILPLEYWSDKPIKSSNPQEQQNP